MTADRFKLKKILFTYRLTNINLKKKYMDKGIKNLLIFCVPLLVAFIAILYCYARFVTGDPLYFLNPSNYISSDSSKWSDFGSLISGLFTLLGSLATIMTMVFLLRQNKDNLQRIDKQLTQAEESYKASVSFNKFQQEQIMFDKFKLHREMFKDLLVQFETDEGDLFISSKMELYSGIFNYNSFTHCETAVELYLNINHESIPSKLCYIVDKRNRILQRVEKDFYLANPLLLIHDIYDFNSFVGLKYNPPTRPGDITLYGQTIVFNVLDVKRSLLIIDHLTLKLVAFSHMGTLFQDSIQFNSSKLTMCLLGYLRQLPKIKSKLVAFPYDWSKVNNNISMTFILYKKIRNIHIHKKEIKSSMDYIDHFLGFYPNLLKLNDGAEFRHFMLELSKRLQNDYRKNIEPMNDLHLNAIYTAIWSNVLIYC
jgi:hypothetical protein